MVRRATIAGLGLGMLVGVPLSAGLSGCAPSQGMAIEDATVPPVALEEGLPPIDRVINRERELTRGRSVPLASRPVATSPRDPGFDPESKLASLPPVESPNEPLEHTITAGRPAPFAGRLPETARPQANPGETPSPRPVRSAEVESPAPRPRATAPTPARPVASPESVPSLEPFSSNPLPPARPTLASDTPPRSETIPNTAPASGPVGINVTPQAKDSPVDRAVLATNGESLDQRPSSMTKGAGWVATVGNEIITWSEFHPIVQGRLRQLGADAQQVDAATRNKIAAQALDGLIEQSLLVQELKKKIKNPKMQALFEESMLKTWEDEELPVMIREAKAANEFELRALLEKSGQSIDRIKRTYVRNQMAREMMGMELRSKMKVDLPEMRSYYNENLKDYDRPAQITWREIQVDFAKAKSKAEARGKADAALQRLRNGEEFAQVAKSTSNGPTATKGGLWETTPGSYNVAAVNATLDRLPIGQISPVIESPTSYHIVLVEGRRDAGPARFDEVQDKIRGVLYERKVDAASGAYLKKLREQTVITTMFDGTDSDPSRSRRP